MVEIENFIIIISTGISSVLILYLLIKIYNMLDKKIMFKKLNNVLKKESTLEYKELLIKIAIFKLKSSDSKTKTIGIQQLSQFPKNEISYKALLDALKNENDEHFQKMIIEVLYKNY